MKKEFDLKWTIDPTFMDTQEKIENAAESLRRATEKDFKKFDEAQRRTRERVRNIMLD